MDHHALNVFVVLLALTVPLIALFQRLGLPAILAYLCAGVLVGPSGLHLEHELHSTHWLGEVGIAFLLFTIGLEFSLSRFMRMRRLLLGLGGMQVLVGTLSGGLIAWFIGIDLAGAVIVGGALSMSSTAIVIKQLSDQLELQADHGRMALGILLFQDLAAVPFLVAIPILGGEPGTILVWALGFALIKAMLACAVLLLVGHWLLQPLFHHVAATRSLEFFTQTVLLVCLLAAAFTSLLGLSLALGTFLAGMMLSETAYRHQIETELRPFRDVLLGLFFITVGLQLDLAALGDQWLWVLLILGGLLFGKGPLIVSLAWHSGRSRRCALRTGIVLGHSGEFGFALLALGVQAGVLDSQLMQPVLAAGVLSMLIAPVFVRFNAALADRLLRTPVDAVVNGQGGAETMEVEHDHVILCGYGRIGQQLANCLQREKVPFIAIDIDADIVRSGRESGAPVHFGDPTSSGLLQLAGLMQARALVVAFDDPQRALDIVQRVRHQRPELPILVRVADESWVENLLAAGATEVVPETIEAGMMLSTQLLLVLGRPVETVLEWMRNERKGRYRLLSDDPMSTSSPIADDLK